MNDDILAIIAALDKLSAELEQRAPSKWKLSGRDYGDDEQPPDSLRHAQGWFDRLTMTQGRWKSF